MLHKIRKIRFPKYEFSYLNYQNDIVNVTSSLTALDSSDDYTQVRKDMRASVTAMWVTWYTNTDRLFIIL